MCPDHVCLKRERYPCISQLWARPCDSLFYQRKQVEPVALAPRHQKRRVNTEYLSASRHTVFPQEPVRYEPLVQRRNKSWRSKLSPTEQKLALRVAIVRFCCTRWSERTFAVGPLGSRPCRRVPSKCQALVSGRQPVRSALGTTVRKETPLPNNSHQRAAELHDLAAHAHRAAAAHHGKEDHQTAHEHSKQALEYSNKAHQRSEEAVKKSADTAV
jgi:hypothetical protein